MIRTGLLLLLCNTAFANGIDDYCPSNVIWGAPKLTSEGNNQYICKKDYAINYNYKTKVAYYVVEHITPDEVSKKSAIRQNDFREDPSVPVKYRSTLKDYTGSGYDRGHLAPAGDFISNSMLMSESFYLTNMMPQNKTNNRGIWKQTEDQVRKWASNADVYVITGTHFATKYKSIGNGVGIPTHIYKIIIQPSKNRMLAYWYPNVAITDHAIQKYIVSVNYIETKTGINFSPDIPPELRQVEYSNKEWD